MTDRKLPARPLLPSVLRDVTASDHLPSAPHYWFGTQAGVLARRKPVVDNSTALMRSQAAQSDAYVGLLDARMRIAKKFGEVADLPNVLAEDQREREHRRSLAETRRVLESLRAPHEVRMAIAKQDVEIAQTREQLVRAQRNLEAAERVAPAEIDNWYAAAVARRNEAEATRQDTDADLQRSQPAVDPNALKAAMADELARAIATIDSEIANAKARDNPGAVMTLMNLRARLKSAA